MTFEPSHLGTELRDDLEAMFWWQKRVAGNAHALSGASTHAAHVAAMSFVDFEHFAAAFSNPSAALHSAALELAGGSAPGGGWGVYGHPDLQETGYVLEDATNIDPMVATSQLRGTGARLGVGARTGLPGDDNLWWEPKRMGSWGPETGAAYVFERTGISADQWAQRAVLRASDGDENDRFGHAIALGVGSRLALVGAPYKEEPGQPEQQNVTCVADGGYFTLSLRDAVSAPIAWNATVAELRDALQGYWGGAGAALGLHPVPLVDVKDWGDGFPLCARRRRQPLGARHAHDADLRAAGRPGRRRRLLLVADTTHLRLSAGRKQRRCASRRCARARCTRRARARRRDARRGVRLQPRPRERKLERRVGRGGEARARRRARRRERPPGWALALESAKGRAVVARPAQAATSARRTSSCGSAAGAAG